LSLQQWTFEVGRKGKERKGKERKGKERKGKERKGKERKGKERKTELSTTELQNFATCVVRTQHSDAKKIRILRRLPRMRILLQLDLLVVPTSGNIVQRLQTSANNKRL
jgi:hypothetical protein